MVAHDVAGRVSEAIVERIKQQILDGALQVGHRLPPEREMARLFNASRVSVREAYRSLQELGLLSIRRGFEGGAFIAKVDHEPVRRSMSLVFGTNRITHRELTEARLLIEPVVARLAASRAQTTDIARLEQTLIDEERALAQQAGEFRPTHSQFHRLIAECARNLPLQLLMDALADLTSDAAAALDVATRLRHRRRNRHFHRLLFYAIARHDEDAAHTIMTEHIADIQRRVRRAMKTAPDAAAAPTSKP